ncbi:MAG: preprotein translocase subunit SecE [Candidatus Pacebacteria bacterium]|nr:preprotein translocase subunit SecE [Candidatus Paceibacterota bacterium]MDD5721946.1 preprotein translocase subunit SecE [Candidatus Paceibacterota bacterium]
MSKIIDYIKQSIVELKKVNWPTRQETTRYTLGVLVLAFIVAIILGFIDFGLLRAFNLIIQR